MLIIASFACKGIKKKAETQSFRFFFYLGNMILRLISGSQVFDLLDDVLKLTLATFLRASTRLWFIISGSLILLKV